MIYMPAVVWLVVGVAGVVLSLQATADIAQHLSRMLALIGFAGALWSFTKAWITQWTTEIAVTDKRVIHKVGLIQRKTMEMNMSRIESVNVDQSIMGRILDYGNIKVRGTGSGLSPFHLIAKPLELRNSVVVR